VPCRVLGFLPDKEGRVLAGLPGAVKELRPYLDDHRFFAIYGEMGAGKTTLIQAIGKELGTRDIISSPTFSLVNEYLIDGAESNSIYHFDFYRIKDLEEVYDIGYEEYFYSDNYCFIEWPEKIETLLPEHYVEIRISRVQGAEKLREITIFKH